MFYKSLIIAMLLSCSTLLYAQDPVYTQYYHSSLYSNPSYAGCARNLWRVSGVIRSQWLNLPKTFKYTTLEVDRYIDRFANVGLQINHFEEGFLYTTQIAPTIAKNFVVGQNGCSMLMIGIQPAFSQVHLNTHGLIFADQIGPDGLTGEATRFPINKFYKGTDFLFDPAWGASYSSANKWLLSFSVFHLAAPSIGLVYQNADSKINRRFSFQVNKIYEFATVDVKPSVNLQIQDQSKVLTIGSLICFKDTRFDASIFYKNNLSFKYNHSFGIGINYILGFDNTNKGAPNNRFRLGLSYDPEFARPGLSTTHGSYEVGGSWEIGGEECPTTNGESCITSPWEYF